MINRWTMEMDQEGLYNGENLHKEGDRKSTKEKIPNKIYCSPRKNKVSKIANPSKNLLLGVKFNLRLYVFSSSDRLKNPD